MSLSIDVDPYIYFCLSQLMWIYIYICLSQLMWIYMYCIWFPVMIMNFVSKAPENSLLNFHLEMNHTARYWEFTWITLISREKAVIEHSSANPKVSSLIPGPSLIPGSWIMMTHISCILFLDWSTTSQRLWVYRISVPYAQKKRSQIPIWKEKGATWVILVSRLDKRW